LSTADGAAIGSDAGEAFSGSITIENVTVNAHSSCDGAAIGAGFFGTFAGEVNIQDGAEVLAEAAQNGAGIGSGYGGSFDEDGQVNITDSTVDAISQEDGAGIGAGASYEESESVKIGGNFAGSVSIDNSFVDAFSDSDGAGIGAGFKGDFDDTGSVTIGNGSVVVAYAENDGCGIGSGQYADFDGTIIIDDSMVNAWSEDEGAGIGASEGGNFNGSVTIRNGSEVTAESYDDGAGIGAGSPWMNTYGENQGSHFTGNVVIEDSDVKAIGDSGAAGIGAGDNGGSFSGSVSIRNSTVYAEAESGGTAIGAGELVWNEETETFDGGDFTGSITVTGKSDLYLYNLNYFNLLGASDKEIGSGTVTFGPEVTLYDAAHDNGIIQREEYPEFIFARLRFQSSGAAGAVGGVAGSVVDTFWRDVEKQIRAAEKGDKITVDAGKRTTMPAFVMDAVEECEVILVIQWDGGEDIVIEEAYDGEVPYRVFQLAELAELLEND